MKSIVNNINESGITFSSTVINGVERRFDFFAYEYKGLRLVTNGITLTNVLMLAKRGSTITNYTFSSSNEDYAHLYTIGNNDRRRKADYKDSTPLLTFKNCNFVGVHFKNFHLKKITFDNCNFVNCLFGEYTRIIECKFNKCNMFENTFIYTVIDKCEFNEGKLEFHFPYALTFKRNTVNNSSLTWFLERNMKVVPRVSKINGCYKDEFDAVVNWAAKFVEGVFDSDNITETSVISKKYLDEIKAKYNSSDTFYKVVPCALDLYNHTGNLIHKAYESTSYYLHHDSEKAVELNENIHRQYDHSVKYVLKHYVRESNHAQYSGLMILLDKNASTSKYMIDAYFACLSNRGIRKKNQLKTKENSLKK